MKHFYSLFLVCFLLISALYSTAQVYEKSTVTEHIEGKKYLIHTISAKQTLFSIAKLYSVTVNDIYTENPWAKEGTPIGQKLKIPAISHKDVLSTSSAKDSVKQDIKTPTPASITKQSNQDFSTHTIEKGQTIYSISRQYGVPVNTLLEANPTAATQIKIGDIIKIPTLNKGNTSAPSVPESKPSAVTAPKSALPSTTISATVAPPSEVKSIVNNPNAYKKSTSTETIDGKIYYIHLVEKGQTAYSIAKLYEVPLSLMNESNPELAQGLRIGMKLKMPQQKPMTKEPTPIVEHATPKVTPMVEKATDKVTPTDNSPKTDNAVIPITTAITNTPEPVKESIPDSVKKPIQLEEDKLAEDKLETPTPTTKKEIPLAEEDQATKKTDEEVTDIINVQLFSDKNIQADVFYNEGVQLFENKQFTNALSKFEEALKLNPSFNKALYNKAITLYELGQYTSAIVDFNQLITIEKTKEVLVERGKAKTGDKDFEGAIVDFQEALTIDSAFTKAYFYRGQTYFAMQQYNEAIIEYDKAIAIDPLNALIWNDKGSAKRMLGDMEGAIADYNKATEINPSLAFVYNNIGSIKKQLKEYDAAIYQYDKAIEKNSTYYIAYNNRGSVKFEIKEYMGAIADYDQTISLNPTYIFAYNNRGNAKVALEDFTGALEDYNKAIELDASYGYAYLNRGILKDKMDLQTEACQDYEQAAALGIEQAKEYKELQCKQ